MSDEKETPIVEEEETVEEPVIAGDEAETPPDLGIHIGEDIDMSEAIG